MQCLLHVRKLPQRLVDRQELRVVGTLFLFCGTQIPGEEGEGQPDDFRPLLEDVVEASVTKAIVAVGFGRDRRAARERVHFDLVEGSDECVAPCDRMGNLDLGAGKRYEEGIGALSRVGGSADRNLTFPRKVGVDWMSWERDRPGNQGYVPGGAGNSWMKFCTPEMKSKGHGKHIWKGSTGCRYFVTE
jgi:hypothetical protein